MLQLDTKVVKWMKWSKKVQYFPLKQQKMEILKFYLKYNTKKTLWSYLVCHSWSPDSINPCWQTLDLSALPLHIFTLVSKSKCISGRTGQVTVSGSFVRGRRDFCSEYSETKCILHVSCTTTVHFFFIINCCKILHICQNIKTEWIRIIAEEKECMFSMFLCMQSLHYVFIMRAQLMQSLFVIISR